ncbi:hypothetical protein [Flavihumibacter fluvii]|uniref:hypothetical protein n=1 Tax=Flavihumibacter fluvii TaxID=2838157 RepID=UPI001BDECBF7|nr:hypothetical protein [Flavihumibacter fluvii]ULQ53243.1 hypothetical protein KJS93_02800 [Flavihumibacter fluvii]
MATDQFEDYYKEKFWEMVPTIYRHEDGLAANPGVLEAIVTVMARQAAILRRSQDQLWDDQFITRCSEWAIPYIGDLVATRMLSALNNRGRRIDVAKTIYYRRRKGTPRILEELVFDISGWSGKMKEQFTQLIRARHGLDPHPESLKGRYSGTLPGGIADLRNPRTAEIAYGPFEEYFHTPDIRQHHGLLGRYNIPKLAFYLYRLKVYDALDVDPFMMPDRRKSSFDPSGRRIPLFSKRLPLNDWDEWREPYEWELSAPIPCRLLGHAEYQVTEKTVIDLLADPVNPISAAEATRLRKIAGLHFRNEAAFFRFLLPVFLPPTPTDPGFLAKLHLVYSLALLHDCGKSALLPDDSTRADQPFDDNSILVRTGQPPDKIICSQDITAANLETIPTVNRKLSVDAENGLFLLKDPLPANEETIVSYHYGFSGDIGAGFYERRWILETNPVKHIQNGGAIPAANLAVNGIAQIDDSKTYSSIADLAGITTMTLQAANEKRPYLRLGNDWNLTAIAAGADTSLVLDGLWLGVEGGKTVSIFLNGNFKCVTIRNCSIDPGNIGIKDINGKALLPVVIKVAGVVQNLCIESSITGPIQTQGAGVIETLSITDSIVQSTDPALNAISMDDGKLYLDRVTVFGNLDIHWLYATETIITGDVDTTDTQHGCFRFSAASKNKPGNPLQPNRLPHPFASFLFGKDSHHWFSSRQFGHPGFAQLSETAPEELVRGAENGSEMGVFAALLNPVKMDGLRSKVEEYMPFGLIAIFINKT